MFFRAFFIVLLAWSYLSPKCLFAYLLVGMWIIWAWISLLEAEILCLYSTVQIARVTEMQK